MLTFRCDHCTKPVFKVDPDRGLLVVRARHHGEWHETLIPLDVLLEGEQSGQAELYNAIRAQR